MVVGERLRRVAEREPARAAIVAGGETWTYGRLWRAIGRCAAGLRRSGFDRGDRVAIRLPDGPRYLVAFFGAAVAGCVAVTPTEGPVADELPDAPEVELRPPAPEDPFYIGYTSGSGGLPTGVVRCHRAWAESFVAADAVFGLGPEDRLLVGGSFVFSANLFFACEILEAGGTLLLDRSARPTAVFAVPTLLRSMRPRPGLRRIITCGEKLSPELRAELGGRFPGARIMEFYGSSEIGFITVAGPEDPPESVGRPFPGVEVAIRDGLLYARSPLAASGYDDGSRFGEWIASGDLGWLDERGCVYLRGRRDETINSGGAKVHPAEVEAVLARHPGVAEAAVFGAAHPVRGWQVVAAIVPRGGVTRAELRAHCARCLPPHKRPRRYMWLDELPRTPGGKVAREALRRLFGRGA